MRCLVVLLAFLCGIEAFPAELMPGSDDVRIEQEQLAHKSREFLRYARNEIFARHGHVFSDPELALYFEHQEWYERRSSEFVLSDIEKDNVAILSKAEENYEYADTGVVKRLNVNGRPVFYVGYDWNTELIDPLTQRPFKFHKGYFRMLDADDAWILDCPSFPPEALKDLAVQSMKVTEQDNALVADQITLVNYDKDCEPTPQDEILITMETDEGDPKIALFGFINDRLELLFQSAGTPTSWECLDSGVIQLDMNLSAEDSPESDGSATFRLDLQKGEYWRRVFNEAVIPYSVPARVRIKFAYFKSFGGAQQADSKDQGGVLKPGRRIVIKEYHRCRQRSSSVVYFEAGSDSGWFHVDVLNSQLDIDPQD